MVALEALNDAMSPTALSIAFISACVLPSSSREWPVLNTLRSVLVWFTFCVVQVQGKAFARTGGRREWSEAEGTVRTQPTLKAVDDGWHLRDSLRARSR